MKRHRLMVSSLLGLLIILLAQVGMVSAHPLDTYVQATYITLTTDSILVDVDLTPGVLITEQVLPLIDTDGDQTISEAEGTRYAEEVKAALRVSVNSQPAALTLTSLQYPAYVDLAAGAAPIQLHFSAPLSTATAGTYQLSFENTYAPADVSSTYLVNGFVQQDAQDTIDITKQDRDWYQRSSVITYTLGTVGQTISSAATGQNASLQEQVLGFLHADDNSVWVMLAALTIAAVLGGLHALTPGHGKTLIAAYLIGSRGTVKHAVVLGSVITLTHTASVIVIGLLALFASQYIVPELLIPVLEIGSGVLVVAIGMRLIYARWVEAKAPTANGHGHAHGLPAQLRFSDIAAMGVSGGIVPCPEALGILLVAIGLNKAVLGIVLLISFSVGLAVVLIALGIVLVRSKALAGRVKFIGNRWQRWLPLVSAVLITLLGAGVLVKGLSAAPTIGDQLMIALPSLLIVTVIVALVAYLLAQRRENVGLLQVVSAGSLAPVTGKVNDAVLPPRYRNGTPVSSKPMGSAPLKFDEDGQVAWNEMWTDFCDLALAGGPPHRGTLLEPVAPETIQADPEGYRRVLAELERGLRLVSGLNVITKGTQGWIGLQCNDEPMALWMLRAILVENVTVRREGTVLYFPVGPTFRAEGEIKNVITVVAKTKHYWTEHQSEA